MQTKLNNKAFIELFDPPIQNFSGPLSNLSFAVKDNLSIQGKDTSFGIKPPVIEAAAKSDPLVAKLLSLGAACVGRTNLTEFALNFSDENKHFGRVLNPGFPGCSILGSSSGSAAAAAMGACSFSLGSDLGGSIRMPAAAAGIFGLKLSAGRFIGSGSNLYGEFDSYGLLCDSLETLERICVELFEESEELGKLHFLSPESCGSLDESFKDLYSKAESQAVSSSQASLYIDKDIFPDSQQAWKTLVMGDICSFIESMKVDLNKCPDTVKACFKKRELIKPEDIEKAKDLKAEIAGKIKALGKQSVLITPSISGSTKSGGDEAVNKPHHFMNLANLLGLPSLTVPIEGQFSLQLISPAGTELALIRAAQKLLD